MIGNQPDLSSLDEFPKLEPSKVAKQGQPRTAKVKERKKDFSKTDRNPDAKPSEQTQNSKEQMNKTQRNDSSLKKDQDPEIRHFTYQFQDKIYNFQFQSEKRVKCPECRDGFKNILNHILKSRCKFPTCE